MTKLLLAVVFAAATVLAPGSAQAQPATPRGYWEGAIEIRGNDMDIAVELTTSADGSWTGAIDIPAQNARGAPLTNVVVDGPKVAFALPGVPGDPAFDGELSPDGKTIAGAFNQGITHLTFRLRRAVRRQAEGGGPRSEFNQPGIAGEGLEGVWLGVLDAGAIELRLALHVSKNSDGTYTSNLDSIDQGARSLQAETTTVEGNDVSLQWTTPLAEFEGKINADGSELEGEWRQGGGKLPLTLHRRQGEPTLSRPQDPRKPYPYKEEEVVFRNESAGLPFTGTLTMPQGDGPHPAVVLITGSGAQDRDESIMGHRPFLVLADHLTRKGIAVLRYDDRGVGGSGGDVTDATTRDFADDTLAAVAYLKSRSEIDAKHIGLIGHSEGALVGPLAAVENSSIAFLVLLAAPGLTGEQIIYLQSEALIRAMGADEEVISANRELQQRMFAIVKEESDNEKARARLRTVQQEMIAKLSPEQQKALGLSEETPLGEQENMLVSPWFRFFLSYDPLPTLAKVKCPMLVIIGENDLQVPPAENLAKIEETLKKSQHSDFQVLNPKSLNHLLQTSETGLPMEYARIEETIAPSALETISSWIRDQLK